MFKKIVTVIILMVLLTKPVGAWRDQEVAAEDPLSVGIEQYHVARELYFAERDPAAVEIMLNAVEALFLQVEEDYDRYYWLGRVAFLAAEVKTGRDDGEAIRLLAESAKAAREALGRDGQASDAHRLLGEVLLKQGTRSGFSAAAYLPQAFLLLEKAVILDPENRTARSALAEYYLEAPALLGGNPQKAIAILESLPPAAGRYEAFLTARRLGKAYFLDGRKEEAAAAFEQALQIYSKDRQTQEDLKKLAEAEDKDQLSAGVYPILPSPDGFFFGVGTFIDYKGFSPYVNGSYDLFNDLVFYRLAAVLSLSNTLEADVGYFRQLSSYYPGYLYQRGVGAQLHYHDGLSNFLELNLFNGQVGGNGKDSITTRSAAVAVAKPLYSDWGKTVGLYLILTAGRAQEECYSITNIAIPLRYKDYRGMVVLGYIAQGEETNLGLDNPVRGYGTNGEEGSGGVLLSIERHFPMFPYSAKPFMGALKWVFFADVGGIINEWPNFQLNKSAGTGLLLDTPLANIRMDLAVTEDLKIWPVFNLEIKVF